MFESGHPTPETALPLSRSSWTAMCLFSYQKVPPASGRGILSDARNSTAAGFAAQLGIYHGHLRGRLLAPSPDREPSGADQFAPPDRTRPTDPTDGLTDGLTDRQTPLDKPAGFGVASALS